MYVSDYTLSLGSNALSITGSTNTNRATLKTGWLHQSNNDTLKSSDEWLFPRMGYNGVGFLAWFVANGGYVLYDSVGREDGLRPVFYLDSTVTISDGTGSYNNPYLIQE